ncbi:MAG: hypothetical protein WC897_03440 [Candidatus Gracilibacteria bacterium]
MDQITEGSASLDGVDNKLVALTNALVPFFSYTGDLPTQLEKIKIILEEYSLYNTSLFGNFASKLTTCFNDPKLTAICDDRLFATALMLYLSGALSRQSEINAVSLFASLKTALYDAPIAPDRLLLINSELDSCAFLRTPFDVISTAALREYRSIPVEKIYFARNYAMTAQCGVPHWSVVLGGIKPNENLPDKLIDGGMIYPANPDRRKMYSDRCAEVCAKLVTLSSAQAVSGRLRDPGAVSEYTSLLNEFRDLPPSLHANAILAYGSKIENTGPYFNLESYFNHYDSKDWRGDGILNLFEVYNSDPSFEKRFSIALKKHIGFYNVVLYAVLNSASKCEVAFGIQLLADCCKENGFKKEFLEPIVVALAGSEDAEKLFTFIALCGEDPKAFVSRCIKIILSNSKVKDLVSVTPNGVQIDKDKLPWVAFFDPAEFQRALDDYFRTDNSPRSLAPHFAKCVCPSDYDKDRLLNEISQYASVPLVEPVEVDCLAIPKSVRVFLMPDSPSTADGGHQWKLAFRIVQCDNGKTLNGTVRGNFKDGKFNGSVDDPIINVTCEWMAVYALHSYYVRSVEADVAGSVLNQISKLDSEKSHSPLSPNVPNIQPIKRVEGRQAPATLEVDIRDSEKVDDARRAGINRSKIVGNLAVIRDLLQGEAVNLDDVMLFRRDESAVKGQFVHYRVPAEELSTLIAQGVDLRTQDFYVMTGIPHTKAAGFYEKPYGNSGELDRRLRTIEPRSATDHSIYSHEVHIDNRFEDVGSEALRPYATHLSIRDNARYDTTQIVLIDDKIVLPAVAMDTNAKILRTIAQEDWVSSLLEKMLEKIQKDFEEDMLDLENSSLRTEAQLVFDCKVAELRKARELSWFSSWLEKIQKDFEEDMLDLENSPLTAEEKDKLRTECKLDFDRKVAELRKARELSCIEVSPEDGASARFTLPGLYESNRIFNQGTFKPLGKVFPAPLEENQ